MCALPVCVVTGPVDRPGGRGSVLPFCRSTGVYNSICVCFVCVRVRVRVCLIGFMRDVCTVSSRGYYEYK